MCSEDAEFFCNIVSLKRKYKASFSWLTRFKWCYNIHRTAVQWKFLVPMLAITVCFCTGFQKFMLEENLTKFTMLMSLNCIYTRTLAYYKIKSVPESYLKSSHANYTWIICEWLIQPKNTIHQRHQSKQHFSWLLQQWMEKRFWKLVPEIWLLPETQSTAPKSSTAETQHSLFIINMLHTSTQKLMIQFE